MRYKNLFSIILILISFAFAVPTSAQIISPKIGVSPHTFDLQVLNGEVVEKTVKLFNQSNVPLPMTIRMVDFTAAEDTGQMLLEESLQDPLEASRLWFEFETKDFILQPGETERINFKIKIPENAEPGGYYAVMLFEPRLPSFYFQEGQTLKNIPEIGVLFLTSIKKFSLDEDLDAEKLKVVEFSLPKEQRLSKLETVFSRLLAQVALAADFNIVDNPFLNFFLKIKNNDIYHIRTSGKVLIYNFFGKIVGEIKVPNLTILPGKTRIFPIKFNPETPAYLKWLPSSISNFLVRNFSIGEYKAVVSLEGLGPLAESSFVGTDSAVLTFFALPWKFWLSSLSIIAVFGFIFVKYRKRIKMAIKLLFVKQKA